MIWTYKEEYTHKSKEDIKQQTLEEGKRSPRNHRRFSSLSNHTHHVLCTTNRILNVRFHGVYSHFQQFLSYIVTTKHEWKTWIVILNCVKGGCLETLILGVGIKAGIHVSVIRLVGHQLRQCC